MGTENNKVLDFEILYALYRFEIYIILRGYIFDIIFGYLDTLSGELGGSTQDISSTGNVLYGSIRRI